MMKNFLIFTILALFMAGCGQQGQPAKTSEPKEVFALQFVEQEDDPGNSGNKPLVLMLHGYGSNPYDLLSLAQNLTPNYHYVSVQAPNEISKNSYSWFDITYKDGTVDWLDIEGAIKSIDQLHTFIESYKKEKDIETGDCYVFGFSQGASMALEMAIKYPGSIAGVIALSGRLVWNRTEGEKVSDKVCKVDIFQAHGAHDPVIPIEDAQKVQAFLSSCPGYTFKSYPLAHQINLDLVRDINGFLDTRLD
jgi:phospholipase/carboxylesterase